MAWEVAPEPVTRRHERTLAQRHGSGCRRLHRWGLGKRARRRDWSGEMESLGCGEAVLRRTHRLASGDRTMMMACVRRLIWSLLASIVVSIGEGLGRIDQAVMRDIVV